jgi:hypothetical protein
MSTTVALAQYRVTHVKVPRSTDNGLWSALTNQVGSPTLAVDSPFRHTRGVSSN